MTNAQSKTHRTLAEFCTTEHIVMSAERVDANPHNRDWTDADHWRVRFTRSEWRKDHTKNTPSRLVVVARMTTYFSMGYGHKGAEPEAQDVLDCLASDASSVDRSQFETWANDLGYDSDSRKAEKIYKACEKGATQLKRFLGYDLYDDLLYHTERL